MWLLLTAVSRTVTQLYTCDTVTYMCSKLMKNFEILICPEVIQYIQIQALTLTEKNHSKRKAPYRPLERTEPLKRKARWKTEAQSVKRSTRKKKEPSQV